MACWRWGRGWSDAAHITSVEATEQVSLLFSLISLDTAVQLPTGHWILRTYQSLSLSEFDSAALQLGRRVAAPLLCYAMVSRLADFFFILRIDRGVTIILIEKLTEPSKTETRFTIDT